MASRPLPAQLISGVSGNADALHTHAINGTALTGLSALAGGAASVADALHVHASAGLTAAARASIWPACPPVRPTRPTVIWQDNMGEAARWTVWAPAGASATLANDAVNYRSAGQSYINGAWTTTDTGHALKITKTAADATPGYNAQIDQTLAAPINCTKGHVYVRYYVHAGVGEASPSNINGIAMVLWSNAGTKYYSLDIGAGNGSNSVGWHEAVVSLFPLNGNGFEWSSLSKISFVVSTTNQANTPSVTLDCIKLLASPAVSPYVFTFDDGYASQFAALAYLASRNLRAHVYIIPSQVGQAGKLTVAQLLEIQGMGHLLCNHTWSHTIPFWSLPIATQIAEIDSAARWLRDYTGSPYANFLATPGASWDHSTMDALLGTYVAHTRDRGKGSVIWDNRSAMYTIQNPASLAAERDTVHTASGIGRTAAVAEGRPVVLLCHDISSDPSLAEFKQIVDSVAADASVQVTTFDDLMRRDLYSE